MLPILHKYGFITVDYAINIMIFLFLVLIAAIVALKNA
jgi:hypothetical protein